MEKILMQILDNGAIHYSNIERISNKLTDFRIDNCFIIADFDGTITQGGNNTWKILNNSDGISNEIHKITQDLKDYYQPIEMDQNMDVEQREGLLREWWIKQLNIYSQFELHKQLLKDIINLNNEIRLRDGIKWMFEICSELEIPVVVLSSGIQNVIEELFKRENIIDENLHIVSNKLTFDSEGFCKPINEDLIIHLENKNIDVIPNGILSKIGDRNKIILLGDSLNDTSIVPKNKDYDTLKIGFLNKENSHLEKQFINHFDIVIKSDDSSLDTVGKIIETINEFQ